MKKLIISLAGLLLGILGLFAQYGNTDVQENPSYTWKAVDRGRAFFKLIGNSRLEMMRSVDDFKKEMHRMPEFVEI